MKSPKLLFPRRTCSKPPFRRNSKHLTNEFQLNRKLETAQLNRRAKTLKPSLPQSLRKQTLEFRQPLNHLTKPFLSRKLQLMLLLKKQRMKFTISLPPDMNGGISRKNMSSIMPKEPMTATTGIISSSLFRTRMMQSFTAFIKQKTNGQLTPLIRLKSRCKTGTCRKKNLSILQPIKTETKFWQLSRRGEKILKLPSRTEKQLLMQVLTLNLTSFQMPWQTRGSSSKWCSRKSTRTTSMMSTTTMVLLQMLSRNTSHTHISSNNCSSSSSSTTLLNRLLLSMWAQLIYLTRSMLGFRRTSKHPRFIPVPLETKSHLAKTSCKRTSIIWLHHFFLTMKKARILNIRPQQTSEQPQNRH